MLGVARDRFYFGQLFKALGDSENNLFGWFLIKTKLISDSC